MNATTAISSYNQIGLESGVTGADPHKLILMLFQGRYWRSPMRRTVFCVRDIPAKGKSISHAIAIIGEGLHASLDKNVGGELAQNLSALYEYMVTRLVAANVKNDISALDEVARLLSELKEAWESIRPIPCNLPHHQRLLQMLSSFTQEDKTMNAPQVISNYESLSALTGQMRDAAIRGEWEKLLGLEHQCSQHVAAMKPEDTVTKLDESARQRKIYLLKKILADDAEIRDRTEGWMEQLRRIMHSNHQEQRVHSAYSVGN